MQRIGGRMLAWSAVALGLGLAPAAAQTRYDPGASDTEIRIGNINPYSGPASAFGIIGHTLAAYFNKVNEEGGINGRRITFISYDDAYTPPRTLEQARKLVEGDEVLLIFQSLGTATNAAIQRYMNTKKVPQLFVATGATRFDDPQTFPWTIGWQPTYQNEGRVYAKYLLANHPDGKVGILYQDDDYGRDYVKGLKDGLAGRIPVVSEMPYESTDATVTSQMITLRASGADILYNVSTPKFAAQAIARAAEFGWKPVHLLNNIAASVGAVLKPAGLDNAKGVLTAAYQKDPTDLTWQDDPGRNDWLAFMDRYFPDGDKTSTFTAYAYSVAQTLVHVLRQSGNDLTRANVMKQATGIRGLALPMLLPGVTVNTSPTHYFPVEQMQMERFNGASWEVFGPVISGEMD